MAGNLCEIMLMLMMDMSNVTAPADGDITFYQYTVSIRLTLLSTKIMYSTKEKNGPLRLAT